MINIQFYSVIHTRTKCTCTRGPADPVLYLICDNRELILIWWNKGQVTTRIQRKPFLIYQILRYRQYLISELKISVHASMKKVVELNWKSPKSLDASAKNTSD